MAEGARVVGVFFDDSVLFEKRKLEKNNSKQIKTGDRVLMFIQILLKGIVALVL